MHFVSYRGVFNDVGKCQWMGAKVSRVFKRGDKTMIKASYDKAQNSLCCNNVNHKPPYVDFGFGHMFEKRALTAVDTSLCLPCAKDLMVKLSKAIAHAHLDTIGVHHEICRR